VILFRAVAVAGGVSPAISEKAAPSGGKASSPGLLGWRGRGLGPVRLIMTVAGLRVGNGTTNPTGRYQTLCRSNAAIGDAGSAIGRLL